MIRHVVLLSWNEEGTIAAVANVTEGLSKLPAQIPEIKSYCFGPDLELFKGNANYVLVADFESEEDFKSYVEHPAHQDFMKKVTGPIMASFHSAQFEVASG